MLIEAAGRYAIDLSGSYLIGDRWRDIDAGANAGCKTIWIDRATRKGLQHPLPMLVYAPSPKQLIGF